MKFIDEVKVNIQSGAGGHGCIGYRREKFVPRGGPDGGDGGRGGDVIFIADEGLNTLMHFRGRRIYHAENGENGSGSQCNGAAGRDIILKVPVGTLIYSTESKNLLADLTEHGEQVTLLKGGRGGHGNAFFKTSTNQTPRMAQDGEPGEQVDITLELKLLADIALIGLPNAGKSTLISSISAAKPKIADYPFTTLEPNLGVVKIDDESLVVADIPGLIEHAAEGKGLGIKFLKHIERTSALVHLLDCAMFLDPFEAIESYMIIREELTKYSEKLSWKKEIVCMTKIDAMSEEEVLKYQNTLEKHIDRKVLPISSVTGKNLENLKRIMLTTKTNESEVERVESRIHS